MEVGLGAQAASVVVSGLLTVFLALVILIAAVWAMGKLLHREKPQAPSAPAGGGAPKAAAPAAKPAASAAAPAPVSAPPAQAVQDDGEEELVAVITAAISAMQADTQAVQTPFRVTGIRRVESGRSSWGMAGLVQNTNPV